MHLILILVSLIFLQSTRVFASPDLECHELLLAHIARQSESADEINYQSWDQLPNLIPSFREGVLLLRFRAESATDLSPARAQIQQVSGVRLLPRSEIVHGKTSYQAVFTNARSLVQLAERIQNLQDRLSPAHWSFQTLSRQSLGATVNLAPPLDVVGFEKSGESLVRAYTNLPGLLARGVPFLLWQRSPAQMLFVYPSEPDIEKIVAENEKRFGFETKTLDRQLNLIDWLRGDGFDETQRLVRYYGAHVVLTRAAFNALAVRQGEVLPGKIHHHPSVSETYQKVLGSQFMTDEDRRKAEAALMTVATQAAIKLAANGLKGARNAAKPVHKFLAKPKPVSAPAVKKVYAKANIVAEPKPAFVATPPRVVQPKPPIVEVPAPVQAPVTGVRDLSLAIAQEFVELLNEYGGDVAANGFVNTVFRVTKLLQPKVDEKNLLVRLNKIGLKRADFDHIMGEEITGGALSRFRDALRVMQTEAGQKAVGAIDEAQLELVRNKLNPADGQKTAAARVLHIRPTLQMWEALIYRAVGHQTPENLEPYLTALEVLVEKLRSKEILPPPSIIDLATEWPALEGDLIDESPDLILALTKVANAMVKTKSFSPPPVPKAEPEKSEPDVVTQDLEWVIDHRANVESDMEFTTTALQGDLRVRFSKTVVKEFFKDVSVTKSTFDKLIHAISKGRVPFGIVIEQGEVVRIMARINGKPKLHGILKRSVLQVESFTKGD